MEMQCDLWCGGQNISIAARFEGSSFILLRPNCSYNSFDWAMPEQKQTIHLSTFALNNAFFESPSLCGVSP